MRAPRGDPRQSGPTCRADVVWDRGDLSAERRALQLGRTLRRRSAAVHARLVRASGDTIRSDVAPDFTPLPDSLRLAAIVEGSDDAILSKDVRGIIMSWNAAAERMFGYRADEVLGRSIRLIVPPSRQSEEDMVLSRVRRGERVEHFETERCRRNGDVFHVSLTVSPVRAADGQIIGASTIARDISGRKRTEEALAAALAEQADLRRRLSTIIAASGSLLLSPRIDDVLSAIVNVARDVMPADAYALWRIDGSVWRVAASAGLSRQFLAVTHPVPSGIDLPPDRLRVVTNADAGWLATRHAAYDVEDIRSMLVVPLHIGSEVSASIAFYHRSERVFTDVEQVSAEGFGKLASAVINTAQMYESQRRSRYEADFMAEATSLLASSLDFREALVRLAHRIVPQVADWCGFYLATEHDAEVETVCVVATAGLEAVEVEAFDREAHGEDAASGVVHVIRSGAAVLVEDWARHAGREGAGGRRREVVDALGVSSTIVVPLVAHARTLGAFTLGTAISGRTFSSDDLRFVQDLAYRIALSIDNSLSYEAALAANRLKDEFLANLSHELRTPLNAIAGYARMLRTGSLPEERRERAFEVLDNNASALSQIVEDVLDISRIITGKIRLHVEPVVVMSVVVRSVETVRPAADAKGIRIDMPAADGLATVAGDADRLQQVFWNLLSNAVKFTPNRGSIAIGLRVVADMCEVSFADSGIGIERHVLPHVFERFRQGDSRFSREHGGLGLGLSIARQIVELHGGTISAESEGPGLGAVFKVCLPLIQPDGVPASTQ
jgi:PAS domain S-box-containing protein